jgi:hypothetical protein
MDATLVLALRIILVAFAIAGVVELARRALGRPPRTAAAKPASAWTFWRSVARVMGLAGVLGTLVGMVTNAATELVIASMALAGCGFVLFVLFSAAAAVDQRDR